MQCSNVLFKFTVRHGRINGQWAPRPNEEGSGDEGDGGGGGGGGGGDGDGDGDGDLREDRGQGGNGEESRVIDRSVYDIAIVATHNDNEGNNTEAQVQVDDKEDKGNSNESVNTCTSPPLLNGEHRETATARSTSAQSNLVKPTEAIEVG